MTELYPHLTGKRITFSAFLCHIEAELLLRRIDVHPWLGLTKRKQTN